MKRLVSATMVACAMVLAACGTPPAKTAASPALASQPQAVAPAPAVRVPASAAKKLVLNMTGPKNVVEAKDWASFKEEWRATFADHAKEAGIAFATQDGEARASGEAGTLLNVYVNDYRQVGIGARIFLGVMTGNAYIDAKVAFSDLDSGKTFGDQAFNTSSSAWGGVFSKMTPQQVDAIASDIFGSLKTR